jgi:hypothetical protein
MANLELTEEQKKEILTFWNDKVEKNETVPSIGELAEKIFGPGTKGSSKEGRLIRDFLGSKNISVRSSQVYIKKTKSVELTEDQQEYIRNNRNTMTPVDMARLLFNNPKLKNIHKEARAVKEYNESLGPDVYEGKKEDLVDSSWKPPKTIQNTIARVNKYYKVGGGIDTKKDIKASVHKEMEALMRYLNSYRFTIQVNSYEVEDERTLFESTFIRYCYDKSDLTEEEVDQYIMLCKEAVTLRKIDVRLEKLQRLLENQADSQDEDKAKVHISLVEAINKIGKEYDDCSKRQNQLLSSLKEKRSDRLSKKMQDNASILNIIATWKNEKTRKELIEIAEKKKQKVKDEVERLESLEDIFSKVIGISQDEALYG